MQNIYSQYIFLKALLHVSMFIYHPQGVLIMYAKVTKLIKWKNFYMWLLQTINRLKPLEGRKMCQVGRNS
jgi:hypothetical protein